MGKTKSQAIKTKKKPNITYGYSNYIKGGGIYITAFIDNEPYADLTINLLSHGITPPHGYVMVPTYKLDKDIFSSFVDDLAERVVTRFGYGPFDAYADLVELKSDWRDKAVPLEDYYQTDNKE